MKLSGFILFVVSLILVGVAFYFQSYLSQFQSLGLLGIFLINLFSSATLFLPAPGFLSVFAGGSIYHPLLVALVASLGSAVGDMVGYLIGYSGRKIAHKKLSKKIWFKVTSNIFHKWGGVGLFFFSLVPNPLFDSMGIVAGIFMYSPVKFLLIVFLGRLIRFIIIAQFGSIF